MKIIKKDTFSNRDSSVKQDLLKNDYEEVTVTIRRNERGFGFEVTQGTHITRVNPSKRKDFKVEIFCMSNFNLKLF